MKISCFCSGPLTLCPSVRGWHKTHSINGMMKFSMFPRLVSTISNGPNCNGMDGSLPDRKSCGLGWGWVVESSSDRCTGLVGHVVVKLMDA